MRVIPVTRFDSPVIDERFADMLSSQFDNSEEIIRTMRDCPPEMSILSFTMLRTLGAARKECTPEPAEEALTKEMI